LALGSNAVRVMGVLEGKVAVVTGGASGIGRASSLRCAHEGARVIVADIQDADAPSPVSGTAIVFERTDVSDSAQVARLMHAAVARWGRLDVLVCAAGVSGGTAATADYAEAEFDRVIAINLKGVFLSMKHAIPEMLHCGGGSVVNVASICG